MRLEDAETEGSAAGAFSEPGSGAFGPISFRSAFGEGAEGAGDNGGELSSAPLGAAGRGDTGDGDTETPKRRRGRPPGSGAKSTTTAAGKRKLLPAAELAAARVKLGDTLAGVVGFGFSWYGVQRANKYKKYSPLLANKVYGCYQIPPAAAHSVGEPLADTFMTWFPQYIDPVSKGIDPALAIGRLISILQQTSENERLEVTKFHNEIHSQESAASTNGKTPPPEDNLPHEETNEWMGEPMPTPGDVLQTPQTHIPTTQPS